jgi:hypothetical protein
MELSSEDAFRLNVLLANKPQAIRIDESAMVVYGLATEGEARVALNSTGRDEQYLKKVRELLSGHITGSPGGYPVFLKRWTRMGQMRDESLEQLLLLGEPEAVVAAVCSPGITDELARRAWWAMQDADNARHLLGNKAVMEGAMGKVLAEYLIEFLPFETETEKIMESVRLVLQPGLMDKKQRQNLWKKSARKQAYQVGFLAAIPDDLPDQVQPHKDFDKALAALGGFAKADNPVAKQLLRTLDAPGQTFLKILQSVLKKPPTQDVVTAALDAVRAYYAPLRPEGDPDLTLEGLEAEADHWLGPDGCDDVRVCAKAAAEFTDALRAMRILSGASYGIVRPVFRKTTAIGSLMRRKLEPTMQRLDEQIQHLCS